MLLLYILEQKFMTTNVNDYRCVKQWIASHGQLSQVLLLYALCCGPRITSLPLPRYVVRGD